MPPYLTFTMAKLKIKLLSYFFPNSHCWVPQSPILGPTVFLLYINDHPDDVICGIAIYADDTALYSKCDQTNDQWQQLEFASELESDLQDTVGWGKQWLVNFSAGKTQLVSFDWS